MTDRPTPSLWLVVLLSVMAGGMGWGIRGQYGHETGAMIAGVLVGSVLVLMFCARSPSLFAARAIAMLVLGVSIGGSMTYGQTLGLTQDTDLIGNMDALRWGLLGTFVKGAIWIGIASAFFAMALSATRYRPVEWSLILMVMLFLLAAGVEVLNSPFDPANRELPEIYFSADWFWKGDIDLKPRPERWGGLLFALAGLYVYAGWMRGDRLVRWLTLWGIVGGGLGFTLGQCVQSFHAWNVDMIRESWLAPLEPHINWWNMMEITYGAVFGGIVAVGLWLHRHHIRTDHEVDEPEITVLAEWLLVVVHVSSVVAWNFGMFGHLDRIADLAITMVVIPAIAVNAGRLWPYLLSLPIVIVPIAGRTLESVCYERELLSIELGWLLYVAVPLLVMITGALVLARGYRNPHGGGTCARWTLLLMSWVLLALNFAFFEFPWPWDPWTGRTPSAIIYVVCLVVLTAAALFAGRGRKEKEAPSNDEPETQPVSPEAV